MKRSLLVLPLLIFATASTAASQQGVTVMRSNDAPTVEGPSENFTGKVRVSSRFQRPTPARISGASVSFDPGAHTAWHSHPLGQTLIVTEGAGLVQQWGGRVEPIAVGDVVWIPPGIKHWHGARPAQAMTHIAIAEALDGKSVDWMEKLTAAEYPSK